MSETTNQLSLGQNFTSSFWDIPKTDTFYLLAPAYYYMFYANWVRRGLMAHDGLIVGFHDTVNGLMPRKLIQSVIEGLKNVIFVKEMDFETTDLNLYSYIRDWAKDTRFYDCLKKAFCLSAAGGSALVKINKDLRNGMYVEALRMDRFFVDTDKCGRIHKVTCYIDSNTNTTANTDGTQNTTAYGLFEERYFNSKGIPVVKYKWYRRSGMLQINVLPPANSLVSVSWNQLPKSIQVSFKEECPSIELDKEIPLPFENDLGCRLLNFTQYVPQYNNLPFGESLSNIILDDSLKYDLLGQYQNIESFLSRGRVLVPRSMVNPNDPDPVRNSLNDIIYQQYDSMTTQGMEPTPIQLDFRIEKITTARKLILEDVAFKLNISSNTVAAFLDSGNAPRTATEITSGKTKTEEFVAAKQSQLNVLANEILSLITKATGIGEVRSVINSFSYSNWIERTQMFTQLINKGLCTPEIFVKEIYNQDKPKQLDTIKYITEQIQIRKDEEALSNKTKDNDKEEKPKTLYQETKEILEKK